MLSRPGMLRYSSLRQRELVSGSYLLCQANGQPNQTQIISFHEYRLDQKEMFIFSMLLFTYQLIELLPILSNILVTDLDKVEKIKFLRFKFFFIFHSEAVYSHQSFYFLRLNHGVPSHIYQPHQRSWCPINYDIWYNGQISYSNNEKLLTGIWNEYVGEIGFSTLIVNIENTNPRYSVSLIKY